MKYYVGIDLGGTNLRVAKVDETGKIIEDVIERSDGNSGPKAIEEHIITMLKKLDLSNVEGVGLAIPGPCDPETNTITQATNIPGCEGYPFAANIQKELGLKVYLDNDANVAGLAEAMFGAGKNYNTIYYLTHSTGIGGGLIIDKKIHGGHKGYAGEVANVIVDPTAKHYEHYKHLNRGGVETIASGKAIGFIGKDVIGDQITGAKDVFNLAKEGDEKALAIIDKMSKDFATCLADICAIVAPDAFVIGGGCSHSSDLYFDKLRAYFKTMAHPGMRDLPILKAELEEPGVLGAAMIVKSFEK